MVAIQQTKHLLFKYKFVNLVTNNDVPIIRLAYRLSTVYKLVDQYQLLPVNITDTCIALPLRAHIN